MLRFLSFFSFIPIVNTIIKRKYYATGAGTLFLNLVFKYLLFINRSDYLIHFTSRLNDGKKIKIIGNDNPQSVFLSFATSGGCYYQGMNGIEIGEGSIWSYNCCFISANHAQDNLNQHVSCDPIKIGKNVWLGANCVVLPGVSIGDNTIIGAGSVVTKSIPSNTVAAGVPCKVIKHR